MGSRWIWKVNRTRKLVAILLHSIEIPLAVMAAYMLGKGDTVASIVLMFIAIGAEAVYNWLKPYWEQ